MSHATATTTTTAPASLAETDAAVERIWAAARAVADAELPEGVTRLILIEPETGQVECFLQGGPVPYRVVVSEGRALEAITRDVEKAAMACIRRAVADTLIRLAGLN